MGNHISVYSETNIFQEDLKVIHELVNNIINEQNLFKNRDYNFLSQDVCEKHYMLAENELQRHLKIHVKELGQTLVLIPKQEEAKLQKREICQRISNHYIKILYILCLIKYVYNLEKHGDYSVSGIVFRNIRIVNQDILEINFCNLPHKDYRRTGKDVYKIDFGQLEGLRFLTDYFLDKQEAQGFLKILRQVLARRSKGHVRAAVCEYLAYNKDPEHAKQLESLYVQRFQEALVCRGETVEKKTGGTPNLFMYVEKDNPVFSKDHCYEVHKLVIPLRSKEAKRILESYETMRAHFQANLRAIEKLLSMMVTKKAAGEYELRDLTKTDLDHIIERVKKVIQAYYLQSILDYQNLLDLCKTIPNVNVSKS